LCVADVLWRYCICRDALGLSIGAEGLGEERDGQPRAGERGVGDFVGGHGSHQADPRNSYGLLQAISEVQASSHAAYPRPGGVHVREARPAQGLEAPPVQSQLSSHGLHKDISTGQITSAATGKTHTSRGTHSPFHSPTVPATLVLIRPLAHVAPHVSCSFRRWYPGPSWPRPVNSGLATAPSTAAVPPGCPAASICRCLTQRHPGLQHGGPCPHAPPILQHLHPGRRCTARPGPTATGTHDGATCVRALILVDRWSRCDGSHECTAHRGPVPTDHTHGLTTTPYAQGRATTDIGHHAGHARRAYRFNEGGGEGPGMARQECGWEGR
jgi:hypothetical protein